MNIKKVINEYNPFVILRRKKMRKALYNDNITFLCPNCIGGILFHDLGLRFCSPTVNLMMTQTDFVKFILNFDYYINKDFEFFNHEEYTCPCAKLDDITVHFTHYHSPEDAVHKWKERVKRINKDNTFIFLTERDGITEESIRELSQLKARGIVVFTAKKYPDIKYSVYIDKYAESGEIGNILEKSLLNGKREYEKYFDFIKWFNEADGGDYDVLKFIK